MALLPFQKFVFQAKVDWLKRTPRVKSVDRIIRIPNTICFPTFYRGFFFLSLTFRFYCIFVFFLKSSKTSQQFLGHPAEYSGGSKSDCVWILDGS